MDRPGHARRGAPSCLYYPGPRSRNLRRTPEHHAVTREKLLPLPGDSEGYAPDLNMSVQHLVAETLPCGGVEEDARTLDLDNLIIRFRAANEFGSQGTGRACVEPGADPKPSVSGQVSGFHRVGDVVDRVFGKEHGSTPVVG